MSAKRYEIEKAIRRKITANPMDWQSVSIWVTADGDVNLSGSVSSFSVRDEIIAAAESTEGVKKVTSSSLTVSGG
ncbi:MAG: BON domain-containing protein [Desulfovibrionaceae bacterium]|nr:BON domain-containing protein [Desulfovibrionaceae bacterium]